MCLKFRIKSFHTQLFSEFTHTAPKHPKLGVPTIFPLTRKFAHSLRLACLKIDARVVYFVTQFREWGEPFKIEFKCQPVMADNVIYNAISLAHIVVCSHCSSIFCTEILSASLLCVIFAVLCVSYTT